MGTVDDIIDRAHGVPGPAHSDSAEPESDSDSETREPLLPAALGISRETHERHKRQIPPYTDGYERWRDETNIDTDTVGSLAGIARVIALL